MKKAKTIGKKTLSVFLAVLMVLTAWVWVAPTEAEAANGTYYLKVTYSCSKVRLNGAESISFDKNADNACIGIMYDYVTNNGRGTKVETATLYDMKDVVSKEGSKSDTPVLTLKGFPTKLYFILDDDWALPWENTLWQITKLELGSSSTNLTTIWSGDISLKSTNQYKYLTYDVDGNVTNSDNTTIDNTDDTWEYPYVDSEKEPSVATAVADIGIPPLGDNKDVSISTRSIRYFSTDQYGVRYEPTSYSVSGVSGLTTGTGWSCGSAYKIEATDGTTMSTVGVSQTATVTMNWNNGTSRTGQKADTTATFQVYNPRYKVTYNGNGGTLGTGYTYAYYYRPINHSTSTATTNNVSGLDAELLPTTGIKEGYTFDGIYTTATGGSKISSTKTVTADVTYYAHWNINQYTATFYGTKANDTGTGTVEYIIDTSTVDYNTNPVPPSTVDGYSLGDYDYTFADWDKEISAIGVNGAEYRATYTPTFVPADYDAVDEIVAEANDIINGENYEGIYSEESRSALENAVNSVVYNQGRTSQDVVDAYVPLIREAIDGLGRQKYSVLFIDAVDNSVIELRYPVYYGDAITLPEAPERGFTSTDHYVFREWTTSEEGDNINFVEKNMIIIANYDKVAHTYTDTELPSNCTTQAGVLHKCSCGYEYVEYSGSVGTEHNLETEWTIDIAPTCTTVGSKSYHCTRCSYRDSVTEIPALDHDLVYQGVVITPGCENDGAEVSECQRCGYDKYALLPAVGHSWTENVIAPTCTSSGYTVKTCSNCHDEDIVSFVDPVAHTYIEATDEYVAPTCTGLGKKVYYCSCGAQKVETIDSTGHTWNTELTTDYEATCTTKGQQSIHCSVCDVINQESITEIPENGHSWSEEVCEQKESCGIKGIYVKTCNTCQVNSTRLVDALTHSYKETVVSETCTQAGKSYETCDNCGDIINYTVLQPLGHDWDEGVTTDATCTSGEYTTYTCQRTDCGATNIVIPNGAQANAHVWQQTAETAATCEAAGSIEYKCTNCTETKTEILPQLGHNYGAWQVVKEPTNTEDGQWKRVCSNNAEHIEYITIPAGGHIWDNGTVTKNATCTTTGTMVYKCNNTAHADCGVTLEVTVPVTQHTIAQKETPATCTSKGKVEAYCSVCDANCAKPFSSEEIPVKAHSFVAQTAVAPTCTTAGYTPYKCSDCGSTYNAFDGAEATGHSYTSAVTKEATCVDTGIKTYTCSCGASYTETIPATGHTYDAGTVVQNQNCTAVEKTEYTCACGEKYTVITKEAKGHTYGDWETVTAATADKNGVQKRTCTCGAVEYGLLAPIGNHEFTGVVTKAATCTTTGTKTYTCSVHTNCSANYTEEIPATGHTQKIEYTAPTCIAPGSTKIVCSVESCKAEIMSETVHATGVHNFDVVGVKSDATCTATGTMTYTCATDGCTAKKTETIPAKGHSFTTTVTDAKCGEKGSVVTECKVCNDVTVKTVTELAAKGHIWNTNPESTVDATCETNGSETYKCQNCNETNVVVIPALGHDWSDWTVIPSTNDGKGSVSRECLRADCDTTETVEIPEGDHNLVATTTVDATCTADGSITYTCDTHKGTNDCGITVKVTVPAKGHTNVVETTQATCEADGSIVEKCGVCGVVHKTTAIPAKGHTTTVTTTPATCTQEGSVVEYCENCKTTLKTTTIEKLQHDYSGAVTVTKEATCTEDGSKTINCKTEGCDATTTVVIPHTGHTWGAWTITTPATNTADGEMTRTCSNNKCTETVVIPAGGHTWDNGTVTKESTCTETGTMVYKCNNAAHADCEVTLEVTIPVTQHTIVKDNKEATCTEKGYSKTVCSVCKEEFNSVEIPVKAHVYTAGTAIAPTCTTSGYTPYTCACGDTYNEYDADKKATGHNLVEGTSTATCIGAGEMTLTCKTCTYSTTVDVPALGHDYVENTSAATTATCKAAATKTYDCSRCDAAYTVSVGEKAAEHTWGAWQIKESATATSLGYRTSECTVCGQLKVETIPATGEHNFNKETSRTNATCTVDGSVTYACSTHTDCGLTSTVTLPATGHTEKLEYTPATCETTGSAKRVCTVETCKAVIEAEEIPALGHLYGEGTVTNATCKDTGKIEYICTRENCGAKHETVIATNSNAHQYATVVTDSTCTVKGSVVTKCALCDNITTNKELPLIEHTWNSGEIKEGDAATCSADGTKTFTCSVCSATKTETIAKLGHAWGAWSVTKASTNTEKGVLTRTCSRGCTETAEIPEGGHNLVVSSETDASCTSEGSITYDCDVHKDDADCGISVTVTLDKTQHELETSKTDATCEGTGSVVTKCKNCNTATITTTIPATGHTYNEGVKTDATCTATGKIVYTCTATDCGKTREVTLEKLQHNYVEGTPVAATCTQSGYTPYKCATCESNYVIVTAPANGHTYVKDSSTATCTAEGKMTLKCACGATMETDVPALGHDYQQISTTAATCRAAATETYKCSRCTDSYTVSVGAKTTEHDWNDWVTVEEATNTSLGYETRTCKTCDKLEVQTIQATGEHKFTTETADKKAATCTEDGYIVYGCSTHTGASACGLTSKVILPALGHTEELSYKAATCTAAGYTKIVCSVENCDYAAGETTIPALDHTWGDEKVTQSTCTTTGKVEFTCTSCKTATKTVEIPVNADAHKLQRTTTKLASCKEEGSVEISCTLCSNYKETVTLTKLQHNWGEWIKIDATNDKDGSWTRTCSNGCTEALVIPAGGHKFKDTPDSVEVATCIKEGTATYKCTAHTACGVTITVKLEKVQHTLETKTNNATCDMNGSVVSKCTVEGCGYKPVDFVILATGHKWDEGKVTTEATCKSEGVMTYTCIHNSEHKTSTKIAKLQHNCVAQSPVAPTCITSGYTPYVCSCGESYNEYDATKPATGHIDTTTSTVPSTCTVKGSETVTCKCGTVVSVKELPLREHDYEKTYADGKYTYTCKYNDCKHSYTEEITETFDVRFFDASGNQLGETQNIKYGQPATAPTAPEKAADGTYHYIFSGWDRKFDSITTDLDVYPTYEKETHFGGEATCNTQASCEVCGTAYGETDASKHVIATRTQAATCEADGWIEYYCTEQNCTYSYKETIVKIGHNFGEWEVYQEGNCASPTISVRKCLNYGCKEFEERSSLSAHVWYSYPAVEPACTTEGYTEYKYCLGCGLEIEAVVIPALGHRDINNDGQCDYCRLTQATPECSCLCHSTGFMKFIYSIMRFFWMITRSSPNCACGAVHY